MHALQNSTTVCFTFLKIEVCLSILTVCVSLHLSMCTCPELTVPLSTLYRAGIVTAFALHSISLLNKYSHKGSYIYNIQGWQHFDFMDSIDDSYAIDTDGPIPPNDATAVSVPENNLHFSGEVLSQLRENVDPLAESTNHGIELYEQALSILSEFPSNVLCTCATIIIHLMHLQI